MKLRLFWSVPLPFSSLVLFPAAPTPIRPASAGQFDQCDQMEEDLRAVQSNPTSESFSAQVRRRTRLTSKAVPRELSF